MGQHNKNKVDVDGAIRVDRVTFARVAKTLLGPRSPTHRTGIWKGAEIGALAKTLYYVVNVTVFVR